MIRGLRIAASVLSLIACVLLVVLWVRSYYLSDVLYARISSTRIVMVQSLGGRIAGGSLPIAEMPGKNTWWLGHAKVSASSEYPIFAAKSGFGSFPIQRGRLLVAPLWFFALLCASFAAAPWIKCRFSLRSLLIAMTLVALVLGLIVGLSRGSN